MNQQERYERQIAIPQIGIEGQAKLQDARVLVIGAGGLGCPVLTYLTASGVGDIKVIDEDIVSESNLNRQFIYRKEDIGEPKAMLAVARMKVQNSNVKICGEVTRVDLNNVDRLVTSVDVVVDCVDNIETRLLVNEACMKARVPLVEAGIQDFYGFVTVVSPEHACLECMGFQNNTAKRITPTIGATAGIIGSMQALECIKIILGLDTIAYGKMLQYDGLYGTIDVVPIQKSPECCVHKMLVPRYDVKEITRFRSDELGAEQVEECTLIQDLGMAGDKYAKGGERQLTLLGSRAKEWMKDKNGGFCFRKCRENLCLEGSISSLRCGDRIRVGESVLEITIDQKDCYPDMCGIHHNLQEDVECLLKEELRYAKVNSSGKVYKATAV
ncbi:MAG: ThiF family adenylyltransferase [Eubacteriales bacterium]